MTWSDDLCRAELKSWMVQNDPKTEPSAVPFYISCVSLVTSVLGSARQLCHRPCWPSMAAEEHRIQI